MKRRERGRRLDIEIKDAQTGAVVVKKSADIRGNTDQSWSRGVSYLVRDMVEKRTGRALISAAQYLCRVRRNIVASLLALGINAATSAHEPLPTCAVVDGVYVYLGLQQDTDAANLGAIANIGFVVGSRCVARGIPSS
jgi:hypothetical protein